MLHVEDVVMPLYSLLLEADTSSPTRYLLRGGVEGDWNLRFMASVSTVTSVGRPLSTAQAKTVLRLIATYRIPLGTRFGDDNITRMLERPIYRVEPYQTTNYPREVRHLGGNLLGFRFKLDPRIVEFFRMRLTTAMNLGVNLNGAKPRFDPQSRLWIVPITRQSLSLVMDVIAEFDFGVDDATLEWLAMAHNAADTRSFFFGDEQFPDKIVSNVCDNEVISFFVTEVLGGEPA